MKLAQAFKRAAAAVGLSALAHEPLPSFVTIPGPRAAQRQHTLSWWQLELFLRCRRCFWLVKRQGVHLPQTFPPALHHVLDGLLKAEFDTYRRRGTLHPLLKDAGVTGRLFSDLERLRLWRSPTHGLQWKDPTTSYTLYAAIHDLVELADGLLAVLDYKSSAAREIVVYPSYQLQVDVATFLLQQMGYRTASKAYIVFFTATNTKGFHGRLPFEGHVRTVSTQPARVRHLFRRAVTLAQSNRTPKPGTNCDLCRWFAKATTALTRPASPTPSEVRSASPRSNGRLVSKI
jgi:hypothetical protein